MKKYAGKYRPTSFRKPGWDYGADGSYFITICTHGRKHFFGEIRRGQMVFTPAGHAAGECWWAIPDHFPFVRLGEFMVMPNHIHGIITIEKSARMDLKSPNDVGLGEVETQYLASTDDGGPGNIETQYLASLRNPAKNRFGPQSKNLASIIRGYKIGVTVMARSSQPEFRWQSRYHDHIIRDDAAYLRIAKYIRRNVASWHNDGFF
jgi:putative transposase